MSADNMIAVMEQRDGSYIVEEMSCEGGKIADIGHFATLRNAMIAAEEHQVENEIEYGVRFYEYPQYHL